MRTPLLRSLPLESRLRVALAGSRYRRRSAFPRAGEATGALLRWTLVLGTLCVLGVAGRASAQAAGRSAFVAGYVLVANPTTLRYRPSTEYAYNATGGSVAISRLSVGHHLVVFDKLIMSPGNVHATAYGTNASCVVSPWGGDSTHIRCFDSRGEPTDSAFSVVVIVPEGDDERARRAAKIVGYALADQPSSESYTPPAAHAYNAAGGAIEARRADTGKYAMSFAGLSLARGIVQINARSSDRTCATTRWEGASVEVACYDTAGRPADSAYAVQAIVPSFASGASVVAYAWANEPTDERYTPMPQYALNSAGGPVTGSRAGAGRYTMLFERMGVEGGSVMVSGYGDSPRRCSLTSWSPDRTHVSCFDPKGKPIDSPYVVAVVLRPLAAPARSSSRASSQTSTSSRQPPTRALGLWYNAKRKDHQSVATKTGERYARASGYQTVREQGRVLVSPAPGTVPLTLWYRSARGDSFTTASARGQRIAQNRGYRRIRVEGYCYATQQPDTVPLLIWEQRDRWDFLSTVTPEGEEAAKNAYYQFAFVDCYLPRH